MIAAGTAPKPSMMRHTSQCGSAIQSGRAMTASANTSPSANMNCQRLPITSRSPRGRNSMVWV